MEICGIYLINLGQVEKLKEKFILPEKDVNNEDLIIKFGRSENINNRFKQHQFCFGKLECNPEILYSIYINKCNNSLHYAGQDLRNILMSKKYTFIKKDINNNCYKELVLIPKNKLDEVKTFYDEIFEKYSKLNGEKEKVSLDILNLRFDNSEIGSIDRYISKTYLDENKKLHKIELNIKDENNYDLVLNVFKYKNPFIFIINEVKNFFRFLLKVKYNIVIINGIKYLAYRNYNDIPLQEYLEYNNSREFESHNAKIFTREIFMFNYLMCINGNYENKIIVHPCTSAYFIMNTKKCTSVFCKFIKETSYDSNTEISKHILKEHFKNSMEFFESEIREMIRHINMDKLRTELLKIVKKYDESYIPWIDIVYKRFLNFKE